MNTKTLRVEELRLGMYVAELDRPWLGTPFHFQGFPLTSEAQIEELKKHCNSVTIDLEKGISDGAPGTRSAAAPSAPAVAAASGVQDMADDEPWAQPGPAGYPNVTTVEQELRVAKEVYSELEQSIQRCLENIRSNGAFEPERLKIAVRSMTRSIIRNPDAMMLLFRMKQKSSREFNRAVDTAIHMITFGRFLAFPGERLLLLGTAGLLLNIGKVKLPESILQKQQALTPDEHAIAREHVTHSVALIQPAKGLPEGVTDIVAEHHERIDGSGYPKGLSGRQISIDSTIAGLVDTYSALTSLRPYAEQLSPSNALSALYKVRGRLFSETLVEKFIQCIGIYPVGSAVELNSGEVGVVVAQNLTRRLQPCVMLALDRDSQPIPHVILDLMADPKTRSGESYRIVRTLPRDKLPMELEKYFVRPGA
jgi:HD-GYP domain-containing protein (c-di-GMP phosphodiesterase class II)